MLWRSSTLIGSGIRATDGSIGSLADLLFDDSRWAVRWAVVDTGSWLPGRKVLLPPSVLGRPSGVPEELPVQVTRQQVKDSPGLGTDAPVSRQHEADVYGHYGLAPYWYPALAAYPGYAPPLFGPDAVQGVPAGRMTPEDARPQGDPHLRSVKEVTGYYVRATDDDIGHVEEFLVAQDGWSIRYVVVDTRNWWPGRKVLVATKWFREVSWAEQAVFVDLTREQVRRSPEYDPAAAIDRDYEERLHAHYGMERYWI